MEKIYVLLHPIKQDDKIYFHFVSAFKTLEHAEKIKALLLENKEYDVLFIDETFLLS